MKMRYFSEILDNNKQKNMGNPENSPWLTK